MIMIMSTSLIKTGHNESALQPLQVLITFPSHVLVKDEAQLN